jgi:hypothetical protein
MATQSTKQFAISTALVSLITETFKADYQVRHKFKFMAQSLADEKVTAEMLNKPEKGEENPYAKLHKQIESGIFHSYTKEVQELLHKEPKTLNEIDKGTRRYWLQQIASNFGKVRTHLAKLENDEANPEEAKTRATRTKKDRIQDHLNQIVKIAKGYDSATFDIKAFLSKAKELDNLLNSK